MSDKSHFIAGDSVSSDGPHLDVHNPATGEISTRITMARQPEVSAAVQAAAKAFTHWQQVTPLNRARILFRFKSLVEQNHQELATLITREHGKVLEDARGEVTRGLEVVEFACGIPHLLKGEYSENVGTGVDAWSTRHPLGVVTGITPFNFPVMVPLWMFPLALACGNTFVLKPSEKTPSAPWRLAELMHDAGLPDGVLNIINGDKETVDTLVTDPAIQAVSFVGSTPAAESIYRMASHEGKRVQALGGAKNHMVIMPDADLEQAVQALAGAAYGSAGERCMAISVAVAVGAAAEPLAARLAERVRTLKIGHGMTPGVEMGPLISQDHRERVRAYIDSGVAQGAQLLVDGRHLQVPGYEQGFYLGGSLFDHVSTDMTIYREEIFGPVLCILRVPDYQSAVSLINAHEYGNGTAIPVMAIPPGSLPTIYRWGW